MCDNCRKRKAKFTLPNGNAFCEDCYWEIEYQKARLIRKKIENYLLSIKNLNFLIKGN